MTFKNRIIGEGMEAPDNLLANPANWRTHPPAQQDALKGVLSEVGFVQRVIVNQRTGFIVDGHARVMIAMRENQPEIPVLYVDLSEEEEKLVLATLDPIGSLAGTDTSQLQALLDQVSTDDPAIQALLNQLAAGLPDVTELNSGLTDENAVPEVQPDPITKPGDVWILGKHRLMCGDSTSVDAFDKLVQEQADMIFTDPPYGMSYGGGRAEGEHTKFKRGGGIKAHGMIMNDDLQGDALTALIRDAIATAKAKTKNGGAIYACFTWRTYAEFEDALNSIGLDVKACIVWDKKSIGLGHSHYRPQHEFIFYCEGQWLGDKSESDVWYMSRGNTGAYVHPTQKPVELIERALANSSKGGDVVIDCFGGSGSTMIACEKTGRHARLMELDPKYCDVIVRRWQEFTGKQAQLEADGRTFSEVEAG